MQRRDSYIFGSSSSVQFNTPICKDRFIPPRRMGGSLNLSSQFYSRDECPYDEGSYDLYESSVSHALFENSNPIKKKVVRSPVLHSTGKRCSQISPFRLRKTGPKMIRTIRDTSLSPRRRQTGSFLVLDAPDVKDDFYLNLLDWSSSNILGVGLDDTAYVWNSHSKTNYKVMNLSNFYQDARQMSMEPHTSTTSYAPYITSIHFCRPMSQCLVVGDSLGKLHLFDIVKKVHLRSLPAQGERISSCAWNNVLLANGNRLGQLHLHDVRMSTRSMKVSMQQAHMRGDVCRILFHGDRIITGGNDNSARVWSRARLAMLGCMKDLGMHSSKHDLALPDVEFLRHRAAVKAITPCPWRSDLIVSGGGRSDKKLMVWNCRNGKLISQAQCDGQVTGVAFNPKEKEFIASEGDSLAVWRVRNNFVLQKVATFQGHSSRVLNIATGEFNQDENYDVVSLSSDESLRFWKVFQKRHKCKNRMPKRERRFQNRNIRL